jgi:hypothetical protein
MSLDEGEMDRGKTLPTPSPPRVAPSLPQGATPLLTGPMVGKHQSKCLRAEGGPPSGLSKQLPPTLETPSHEGVDDPFICVGGREMGSISLLDAHQVLKALAIVTTIASSCLMEFGPTPKKVYTQGCLLPSACYMRLEQRESFFHNLSPLVPDLRIHRSLSRKRTLGALDFCWLVF